MGFTEWLESLTPMLNVVRILAGVGFVTVLLAYLRRVAARRCWRNFKARVHDWVDRLVETENRHPNHLSEEEWQAACESMLTDANFGPMEIRQLLDLSVTVAKGIAADKMFI